MSNTVNLSVFVPFEKENEYFEKNTITFKKLPNGITMIGIPKEEQDIFDASTQYVFNSGSHNDPIGKKGIHHLFEHLLVNLIQKAPKSVDIYKNAYTSHRKIIVDTQGTANPKVKQYGMWPMIKPIISSLKDPLEKLTISQIENEVKIVLQEIAEKNTDPSYHAYRFMYECIYANDNPLRADTLGNETDLKSISSDDLSQIANHVFVPQGLTIRTFTQGNLNLAAEMLLEIEKEIIDFPREKTKPLRVDVDLQDSINPTFKPGNVYVKNDGLKNNLISVNFVWIIPAIDFTSHSFALSRLMPIFHDELLSYSRKNGLGYSSYATSSSHKNFRTITMSITLNKNTSVAEIKNTIFPGIKKHTIENLDSDILQELYAKEKLVQIAVPMSTQTRANILQDGLDIYNRVIDADKVKNEYQNISLSDFKDWRNKLLQIEPAIIISGDID